MLERVFWAYVDVGRGNVSQVLEGRGVVGGREVEQDSQRFLKELLGSVTLWRDPMEMKVGGN